MVILEYHGKFVIVELLVLLSFGLLRDYQIG